MRASFWVIAPPVAPMRQARVSLPGGCAIGTRPVDLLMMALEKLGADISIDRGYVIARAPNGLRGGRIDFPKVTVSGTHVALMAASLARGSTVIDNAACEPEIADVASCLNKIGAHIEGAGTPRITIEGVARLHGARHTVLPDRIEAGTYAIAATMTGGDLQLAGARPELLQSALDVLKRAGAEIPVNDEGVRVARDGAGIKPVTVSTAPFPGFPTDLQAQWMALIGPRTRCLGNHRDDFRKPLHACARAGAVRRADQARGRERADRRHRAIARRACDGDRPVRLGVAGDRGPCRRGRDHGQPRLSSRSRF
jgi:UDP-N-acetylglucosamine 1-carboxyvinyltransferase